MAVGFLTLETLGMDTMITRIGAIAAETPAMLMAAEVAAAQKSAVAATEILKEHTPVGKTEQLKDKTTYTISTDATDITIGLEQPAESKSGFPYAKARAFGHRLRNDSWWTPPEDPFYPVAAQEEARPLILAIEAEETQVAMKAIAIGAAL